MIMVRVIYYNNQLLYEFWPVLYTICLIIISGAVVPQGLLVVVVRDISVFVLFCRLCVCVLV